MVLAQHKRSGVLAVWRAGPQLAGWLPWRLAKASHARPLAGDAKLDALGRRRSPAMKQAKCN
jgi:hypothetical protein